MVHTNADITRKKREKVTDQLHLEDYAEMVIKKVISLHLPEKIYRLFAILLPSYKKPRIQKCDHITSDDWMEEKDFALCH